MSTPDRTTLLVRSLRGRYDESRKLLLASRKELLEKANTLKDLEAEVLRIKDSNAKLDDMYKTFRKRNWQQQLLHTTPHSISSGLYEEFKYDEISAYADMALIAEAGEKSETVAIAMRKVIIGHFTKDAILSSTIRGADGRMTLFPPFVAELVGLVREQDVCKKFHKDDWTVDALESVVRSVKSNLSRNENKEDVRLKRERKRKQAREKAREQARMKAPKLQRVDVQVMLGSDSESDSTSELEWLSDSSSD